jgi:hypothetical protein
MSLSARKSFGEGLVGIPRTTTVALARPDPGAGHVLLHRGRPHWADHFSRYRDTFVPDGDTSLSAYGGARAHVGPSSSETPTCPHQSRHAPTRVG